MREYNLAVTAQELRYIQTAITSDMEAVQSGPLMDEEGTEDEMRAGRSVLGKIYKLEQAEVYPN